MRTAILLVVLRITEIIYALLLPEVIYYTAAVSVLFNSFSNASILSSSHQYKKVKLIFLSPALTNGLVWCKVSELISGPASAYEHLRGERKIKQTDNVVSYSLNQLIIKTL